MLLASKDASVGAGSGTMPAMEACQCIACEIFGFPYQQRHTFSIPTISLLLSVAKSRVFDCALSTPGATNEEPTNTSELVSLNTAATAATATPISLPPSPAAADG